MTPSPWPVRPGGRRLPRNGGDSPIIPNIEPEQLAFADGYALPLQRIWYWQRREPPLPTLAKATELSNKIYSGQQTDARPRHNRALDQLKKILNADPKRIAAIGYCFGGAVAPLNSRAAAAPLAGIVLLPRKSSLTKTPEDAKNIKGKVLICTGADDSFVPATQVADFQDEMRKAGVDWQVISYGGAHHAFTNPDADSFKIPNIAYNAAADKRSWQAMKSFFEEVFGK